MCCHAIELETVVVRNQQIDATDLDGEKVMMDLEKGQYFTLNGVGGYIWDITQEPISVKDLIKRLQQVYEVSVEECESSVKTFIHQMIHANLMMIHA